MTFIFQIGKKMSIKEELGSRLIARNHAKKYCEEHGISIRYYIEGEEYGEVIRKI